MYRAKKSLMITFICGLAIFVAFLILYFISRTFSIREIIANVHEFRRVLFRSSIIILILIGAFTKSAQFPFHIWLPGAMEAPTPVSAYLHSATMVKAGIYIVARFTPIFGGIEMWFWLVSGIGLFTLFWAALTAIRQTDLKALLAYSTVSQLDRKSTRLNSSHVAISYAVFCLKKKKIYLSEPCNCSPVRYCWSGERLLSIPNPD